MSHERERENLEPSQNFHLLFTSRYMNAISDSAFISSNPPRRVCVSFCSVASLHMDLALHSASPINNNSTKILQQRVAQTRDFIMSNGAIWRRRIVGVQRRPITLINSTEPYAECQVINFGCNTNSIQRPD